MALKFSDGVTIPTEGEIRAYHASDGWYVVGEGVMCPCDDEQDAKDYVKELKDLKEEE